ncbi:MAG: DoxX family protein [Rikenellaceae bacterium]|jgi:putative oxidoreductase|nr:DoxX family protein [Rikenellaceae bacterium]
MTLFKETLHWLLSSQDYDIAPLLLRVVFGALMLTHGWAKLSDFANLSQSFSDPIGIGAKWSLMLIVFAEFFCSILLILGLLTKLAVLPLIIGMVVAAFFTYPKFTIAQSELALLYLSVYLSIFFLGAGKYSVDSLLARWLL